MNKINMDLNFYLIGVLLIILMFSAWKDVKEQRIPNEFIIRGIAIRILLLLHEIVTTGTPAIRNILFKMLICIVILIIGILVRNITRNGVGMGDIKLMTVMYLYLDSSLWMNAVFCSMLCGLVHAAVARIRSKATKRIPFAPSLFLGTLFAMGIQMF